MEVCDKIDNDCDGEIDDDDENLISSTRYTYFVDADGDGFPDVQSIHISCEPPQNVWSDEMGEPIVVDDIDQETILLIAMTTTKIYIQIVRCWNQIIYVPLMLMVMVSPQ